MFSGFGGLGLTLPNAGDMATAKQWAAAGGYSVPYNVVNFNGAATVLVVNPDGTTASIPLTSMTAPYADYAGLALVGVKGLSDTLVGAALSQYGTAGGGAVNYGVPPAPNAGSTIAQSVNAPASANPQAATPASTCFSLFGESCISVFGFQVGIYTVGIGALAAGLMLFGGGHRGR